MQRSDPPRRSSAAEPGRATAGSRRLPRARPLALGTLVAPIVLGAGLGLLLGLDARPTLLGCVAVVVGAAMVARLELAALVVVAAGVLDGRLRLPVPYLTEVLALLLVGAWVVRRASRPFRVGLPHPVLLVAAAFLAVVVVAGAVHPLGLTGGSVVLRYAALVVTAGVLVDVMRGGLAPRRVAAVYVAACAVTAVVALAPPVLGRGLLGEVARGDASHLTAFLVVALPLGVALRVHARRAWTFDLAVVTIVLALLGSLSWAVVLGLGAAAVTVALTRVVAWRTLLVAVVVATSLAALTAAVFGAPVALGPHPGSTAGADAGGRSEHWRGAMSLALDDPVLGRGPGASAVADPDDPDDRVPAVQDTYLEVAAELGVLGLLAWLALLGTSLAHAWRRWRADRAPLAAGVAAAIAASGAAALLTTVQGVLPWWLLVALAAAMAPPGGRRR